MLEIAKPNVSVAVAPLDDDIAIGVLLAACDAHASAPLVFAYGGRDIRPGYHVTEVKAADVAALDCGGNPETWSEIFIQLWDVVDGDRTHMTAGKFAAIIRKVSTQIALDRVTRLTFEVSDGVAPIELHRAGRPELVGGALLVALSPRPASCKPRDSWLESQNATACCGPSTDKRPCCG